MSPDLLLIGQVVAARRRLRSRERWTPERVQQLQARRRHDLLVFAARHSPYYRRLLTDGADVPLAELPVLTKDLLLDHYDEVLTAPLSWQALRGFVEQQADSRYRGYWVSATSGASGRPMVVPTGRREWVAVLASYARANEWAGSSPRLLGHTSIAVVASAAPEHQSSRVAASQHSPSMAMTRIGAACPLPEIVATLNDAQPEVLVSYASMLRVLAAAQLAGTLRIHPRAVNSSSEVLTPRTRELAAQAWGRPVHDVYAATETGGIAAECRLGSRHLFDDLLVCEVIDEHGIAVSPGTSGRLLVTVLHSRTLPLVRYEVGDRVALAAEPCRCGLPFRTLALVEGRTDDLLLLPDAQGGTVTVHPSAFHPALERPSHTGWQVRQVGPAFLDVLVATEQGDVDPAGVAADLRTLLTGLGLAHVSVSVVAVPSIPPAPSGKRPVVVPLARAR